VIDDHDRGQLRDSTRLGPERQIRQAVGAGIDHAGAAHSREKLFEEIGVGTGSTKHKRFLIFPVN
jgi:hypothetical protein